MITWTYRQLRCVPTCKISTSFLTSALSLQKYCKYTWVLLAACLNKTIKKDNVNLQKSLMFIRLQKTTSLTFLRFYKLVSGTFDMTRYARQTDRDCCKDIVNYLLFGFFGHVWLWPPKTMVSACRKPWYLSSIK